MPKQEPPPAWPCRGLHPLRCETTRTRAGNVVEPAALAPDADEFVYVLYGHVVLVTDSAKTILEAGDCAAFKAGNPEGYHLQNRDAEAVLILEVGTASSTAALAEYPDIDLKTTSASYFCKNGALY
jgi:hypothetical protein